MKYHDYSSYRESPILADAIERLYVSISHLRIKAHLTEDDTKLLAENIAELIQRIIEEFHYLRRKVDYMCSDVMQGFKARIPQSDNSEQMERNIVNYTPQSWEVSLVGWIQRHHHRVSKTAELVSSMTTFEALKLSVRQKSLSDLISPLASIDFCQDQITSLEERPDNQVKYFSTSLSQARNVLEMIIPIVRTIRSMKRGVSTDNAGGSPPSLRHGFLFLKESCARFIRLHDWLDDLQRFNDVHATKLGIPESICGVALGLADPTPHGEIYLQAEFILQHELLPTSRPSTASLSPGLQELSSYLETTKPFLQCCSAKASLLDHDAYLENYLWQLEDIAHYVKERDEVQKTIDRLIHEESACSVGTAIAALPMGPIDASMLDENDAKCGICHECTTLGEVITILPICSHWFHTNCIRSWAARSSQTHDLERSFSLRDGVANQFEVVAPCPYCRKDVFTGQTGD